MDFAAFASASASSLPSRSSTGLPSGFSQVLETLELMFENLVFNNLQLYEPQACAGIFAVHTSLKQTKSFAED